MLKKHEAGRTISLEVAQVTADALFITDVFHTRQERETFH